MPNVRGDVSQHSHDLFSAAARLRRLTVPQALDEALLFWANHVIVQQQLKQHADSLRPDNAGK